ncbi:MAG TPA: hypothetical protein VFB13_17645 [Reyranella sp.]|jgi:hypothetical protein|nr:hypothetical protein [Reyranella sp.]
MRRALHDDNGHSLYMYGQPLGVECAGCGRRALLYGNRLHCFKGDMTLWTRRRFKCSSCGGHDVVLWYFLNRDEADWFAERPLGGPTF